MRDGRFLFDLDVDGVCGNILDEEYVRGLIGDLIPNFSESMLTRYNLADIGEISREAERRLRTSFCDPEHLRTMPRYDGVETAVKNMSEYGTIVFHTLMFDEKAVAARAEWLQRLITDSGIQNAVIQIDVGRKTSIADADVLIEDNPDAFALSNAPLKIRVRHPYNTDCVAQGVVPANNIADAAEIAVRFLSQCEPN